MSITPRQVSLRRPWAVWLAVLLAVSGALAPTLSHALLLARGGVYTGQGTTMSATGVPYGIAVPGAGRSIYAGVTVKF